MFETTQGSVDVGIMTRNIGAMKTFYRDVLGLEETINSVNSGDIILISLKKEWGLIPCEREW